MSDENERGKGGFTRVSSFLPGLIEQIQPPPEPERKAKRTRKNPISHILDNELIPPEDLAYVHSILLQCFMPLRHRDTNAQRWETGNRNAKLVIRAGELVRPDAPGEFKRCVVPAGPKARIVSAYIFDYAYRHKTPEVDLGENLHRAMQNMGVPVGGKNQKELAREVENFAAAEIVLGIWSADGSAHTKSAKVAEDFSFWIEKNPAQKRFWTPTMRLSERMYKSIRESQHMAPIHWPAYIALQHNPRAMDVFAFLAYRLRNRINRPVVLHASVLHQMFGRDIQQLKHFWPRFISALKLALEQYPTARVEIMNDALKLHSSPPLVAYKKVGSID